jgi:hypothetical protein
VPGPDLRPVLVVEILKSGKVVCAYGSAAKANGSGKTTLQHHQIEVLPSNTSGLSENTRFDFIKRVPLNWTDEWFAPCEDRQTVRIGTLDAGERTAASTAKQMADNLIANNPARKWPKPKVEPKVRIMKSFARPSATTDGQSDARGKGEAGSC